jgi:predicted  nucleic acid-binding Zn-ribbon protein
VSQKIDPRILSQLAHFDGEVHRHRHAIEMGRKREAVLAAHRVEVAAEAKEKRTYVDGLKDANRKMEKEVEEFQRQAKLHGGRLNEIQDSREYAALNQEVKYLLRQAENKEETILENMEAIERAESDAKNALGEFENREKEILAERDKILAEREMHEKAMKKAASDLELYLTQIDPQVVRFYRRRADRQDRPVVWATKGACGFCHTRMTPQAKIEAETFKMLVTCETCGRIVVGSLTKDTTVS